MRVLRRPTPAVTADVVAPHAPPLVALTLAAYLTLYLLLIVAYVAVLRHMAEHPLGSAGAASASGTDTGNARHAAGMQA